MNLDGSLGTSIRNTSLKTEPEGFGVESTLATSPRVSFKWMGSVAFFASTFSMNTCRYPTTSIFCEKSVINH